MLAGALRVTELATGAEVTPANARFFATPAPVVVHIVGATVYCLLGAFQFVPGIRGVGIRAGTATPDGCWCRAASPPRCPGSG